MYGEMLIVGMAELVPGKTPEGGDIHAIIVNQLQLAFYDQDVAVLQVAMGDVILAERRHHLQKPLVRAFQDCLVTKMLTHKSIQRDSAHAVHLQNRVPGTPDPGPLLDVAELNRTRESRLAQML